MFEKEAEEYAIDNYENCLYDNFPYTNDSRAREQSFKDGAEFGYNKGREQIWHDLRKHPDDLPEEYDITRKASGVYKEEKSPHIVLSQNGDKVQCIRTIGNKNKVWFWAYDDESRVEVEYEVIAWTEIPMYEV